MAFVSAIHWRRDVTEVKSLHILHIEDDETQGEVIWKALSKCGLVFHVSLVTSQESYKLALEEGDVDLVLSDSSGDDFNGEDALRYLRANYPGIPFLFVSASYSDCAAQTLMDGGASDCLTKSHLRGLAPAILRATRNAIH